MAEYSRREYQDEDATSEPDEGAKLSLMEVNLELYGDVVFDGVSVYLLIAAVVGIMANCVILGTVAF